MHAMGMGTSLPLPPWSHFSPPWECPQGLPGLIPQICSSLHPCPFVSFNWRHTRQDWANSEGPTELKRVFH